jgi:hypothetical protein
MVDTPKFDNGESWFRLSKQRGQIAVSSDFTPLRRCVARAICLFHLILRENQPSHQ